MYKNSLIPKRNHSYGRGIMSDISYSNYREWKGWQPEDFGIYSQEDAQYFDLEMRKSLSRNQTLDGLRLIEIGFGVGKFSTWCVSKGVNYSGVEIIDSFIQQALNKGIEAYSIAGKSLIEIYKPSSVDTVVAFDVFEHMELDILKNTLSHCREILRPGGKIFGRVPSGDSPFARSIQYGDITHCSILGASAIGQLASELDFEVIAIRAPAFPMTGLGLNKSIRRGFIFALRLCVNSFIAAVMMGNSNAVLTPNLCFILQRPETT
jgi:2-polyprenyl-3-methyl-5-hydroxy-6-metoxy-1,4-benzoquinol methylase